MKGVLVSTGLLIACRAFLMQVVPPFFQTNDVKRLSEMAGKQFRSKILVRPKRGSIFDRNNNPLVVPVQSSSLAANPKKLIHNREHVAKLLASALGMSDRRILQRLKKDANDKKEFQWLKRHLSDAELNALTKSQLVDARGELPSGLWLVKESTRMNTQGKLAEEVLGHVDVDVEGIDGIELEYNDLLHGEVRSVDAIRDALGRPSFIDADRLSETKDGLDLTLSLDIPTQHLAETELEAAMKRTKALGGMLMAMDSESGEIYAMASRYPVGNGQKPKNHVVVSGYEPGSTFKAAVLGAALKNSIPLSTKIYGELGHFRVKNRMISEAEAHERFAWINLQEMIEVSSNVVAAKLALKIGRESLFNHVSQFEFGKKTGIDFPGEISGILKSKKQWNPVEIANMGFGHGILVTPLQMVRFYSSIFNGGYLVKPRLTKSESGQNVQVAHSVKVFSDSNQRDLKKALLSAVNGKNGTGGKAVIDGYTVYGKTGTAQKVDPRTGRYSSHDYVTSFIGTVSELKPKLVILALLDSPRTSIYAAETAAPLFHDFVEKVLYRFEAVPSKKIQDTLVKPVLTKSIKKNIGPVGDLSTGDGDTMISREVTFVGFDKDGKQSFRMPALSGLSAREVLSRFSGKPVQLNMDGLGFVVKQLPVAGAIVSEDGAIDITLGPISDLPNNTISTNDGVSIR